MTGKIQAFEQEEGYPSGVEFTYSWATFVAQEGCEDDQVP